MTNYVHLLNILNTEFVYETHKTAYVYFVSKAFKKREIPCAFKFYTYL